MKRLSPLPVLALTAATVAAGLATAPPAEGLVIMRPPPPRWDPRVAGRVVTREDGPPPISGGTLLVLPDGSAAVVSDPDRDRVQVVELDHAVVPPIRATVHLPRGSQPGRAAVDAQGRVHVVLRGSGEVASFPADEPSNVRRRAVCSMPRGITVQGDQVHVACRSGELVSLEAATGVSRRNVRLQRDLRDAFVVDDRLFVTRFRDAELLAVDSQGAVTVERRPARVEHETTPFANRVAWRSRPWGDGALMLHQRHSEQDIEVRQFGGYGAPSPGACDALVRTAVSVVGTGRRPRPGPELDRVPLPVDFALKTDEAGDVVQLAVIAAGNQSDERSLMLFDNPRLDRRGCLHGHSPHPGGHSFVNAVAVGYGAHGELLVQTRDPATLLIATADLSGARMVGLAGESTFDTGHSIFHAATASELACASCHPEGGDDGHVWRFRGVGPRRTPALHQAAGTSPFHWTGELDTMASLMGEVFTRRMSGPRITAAQSDAVEGWLGHLPAPHSGLARSPAVERGDALFHGSAGCAGCHAGPQLTNLANADVGTGREFQVPSLIGVADRLPVMHDGCATTLRRRFVPRCGGRGHNRRLRPAEIDDLVAYMETL